MSESKKMERFIDLGYNGEYFILLHAYPYNLNREDYGKYEWRYKLAPTDEDYIIVPTGNGYESFVGAIDLMRKVEKTIYVYCHVNCEGNEYDTELTCICDEDTFDSQLLRNTFEKVGTFDEKGNGNKIYSLADIYDTKD
ncbi:MAG: hypothetical protein E7231_01315 [Cellulosilyticum sp.]|nr:hypothetical protein [Cellulosilyticum sp.]